MYILSLATGRLKYLSYMASLVLLCVNVFGMHYAVLYLGQGVLSPKTIMALIGFTFAIPNLTYFTKLRGNNDYDFCNIFIQTGIFKMTVVVGVGLLLNNLLGTMILIQHPLPHSNPINYCPISSPRPAASLPSVWWCAWRREWPAVKTSNTCWYCTYYHMGAH